MASQVLSSPTFEHHHSGLGLSNDRPRISWHFIQHGAAEFRDWIQSAYELQVARGTGEPRSFHEPSSDSVLVPWPDEPLCSREQARVRVRVFGVGSKGKQHTAWSPWATVEAALLSRDCWTAYPITSSVPDSANVPRRPLRFRKAGTIPQGRGKLTRARLYVTSLGVYEAYINGSKVGDQVMAPGWTSYEHRLCYQVFDVLALLKGSTSICLGAEVAEGWYAGRLGWGGGTRFNYGREIGILAQLEVDFEKGERYTLASDESWRCHTSPIIRAEIYDGEFYDMRQEVYGWTAGQNFDVNAWDAVKVLPFPMAALSSPDAPPVRVVDEIRPLSIFKTPSGRTVIDFGQNLVGTLHIKSLTGTLGQRIGFTHAEALENGEIAIRPLRHARCTDEILTTDSPLRNWSPKFTIHGFRFVQVEGWEPPQLSTDSVTARVMHTDMVRTGTFNCSQPLLRQLHQNAVWSMRGNFVSLPTDCPQRDERLGWTGDIQIFCPSASFLYRTTGMLTGWLQDLASEQAGRGGIPPFTVPDVMDRSPPFVPQAVWGDVAVLTPWDLYVSSGDDDILRRQYKSMTSWVLSGIPRGPDRLWDPNQWQFGDWLDPKAPADDPGDARTDGTMVADAYLVRITSRLARVSRILGYDEDTVRFEAEAHALKTAFQYKYITAAGLLVGDTQTALALAIVFDLLDGKRQVDNAATRLVRLVEKAKFRVATGFVGTPIITHALSITGNEQLAYRMLAEKECPSWLYPITKGATTIWERWDSMLPDGSINPGEMTSFNHYALGSVIDWLHTVVAGIRPRAPGWKSFDAEPRPGGDVHNAEATYNGPYGKIECKWCLEKDDHGEVFKMGLVVPPNSYALVTLPEKTKKDPIKVGSGSHTFSCRYTAKPVPFETASGFATTGDTERPTEA